MDELWRWNGRQRHVGGCCWHHDPSRTTSIPPEGPASAPDCALPSQAAASAVPWARSLRNPATRTPTDSEVTPLDEPDLRIAAIAAIAAIALNRSLISVTGNVRHFDRVDGLENREWLESESRNSRQTLQ